MALVTNINGLESMAYHGVTFFLFKSSVTAKPQMDSSGRTTKWVDFDIVVDKALVEGVPPATTDDTLLDMRKRLTKTGQALTFVHKGYGPLSVNVPGGDIWDANFGPHPEMFDWQPTGNNLNAFVGWRCKTSIPQCDEAKYRFAIAELNYDVDTKWDIDGYPTIITKGHLVIPMTRLGDTRIPDHVDLYKEEVQTAIPLGFVRRNHSFQFNEAKTVLNFSWEDVAERVPMPEGITRCQITHKCGAAGPAFTLWNNSISGTINVPPTVPKEYALRVFLTIVADRLNHARQQYYTEQTHIQNPLDWFSGVPTPPLVTFNNKRPTQVIPTNFSASNEINSHGASFQYDFRSVIRRNIETDVEGMGLWRPFPQTSWEKWRRSMETFKVTDVRSPYNLRWNSWDDAIIDLCIGRQQPVIGNKHSNDWMDRDAPGGRQPGGSGTGGTELFRMAAQFFTTGVDAENSGPISPTSGLFNSALTIPNPESSWLEYNNVLTYREPRGRYARHRPLTGTVTDPQPQVDAAGIAKELGRIANGTVATAWKDTPDILQEVDAPYGVVILKGGALRMGAPTPIPNLLTCQGSIAKRNRVIECTPSAVVSRAGDIPIIRTTWEIEFLLDTPPRDRLPFLSNPILGIDGGVSLG